uniref:Uncharacterized protein n=1 Tax=Nelumbo nucifera TaxID=4432 RepID=A0A822Z5D8_NELNU|nr:TPA_asm: hypothetical protein HUJ06_014106 [Nelumbo nucifera]
MEFKKKGVDSPYVVKGFNKVNIYVCMLQVATIPRKPVYPVS